MNGVYVLKNIENERVYVGSTVNLSKRKTEHFNKLRKGKHKNRFLQKDYDIFGEKSFEFIVMESNVPDSDLPFLEKRYLDLYEEIRYNIYKKPNYINEQARSIISEKCSGELNGNYHKTHSESTRKLIRDRRFGEEYVNKPKPKYKRKSEEEIISSRKRMSERMKGRVVSEETRKKISKSRLGVKHSPETREKIKEKNSGNNNPNAKLSKEQVLEIYEMMHSNISYKKVCEQFGIVPTLAYRIKKKEHWVFRNG